MHDKDYVTIPILENKTNWQSILLSLERILIRIIDKFFNSSKNHLADETKEDQTKRIK